MKKCPYCKSVNGYFTKDYGYGRVTSTYGFNGEEADNTEMHNALQYKAGKVAYCVNCEKKLFNMQDGEPE